jgi:signal transduction histidine kinase
MMRLDTIRARMLAAALTPVFLVVVVLVLVFWQGRVGDLGSAHAQRNQLLVRQVALASEYGLFSGNFSSLQNVVSAVQREADVRWVGVFDVNGRLVASAGGAPTATLAERLQPQYVARQQTLGMDALVEAIAPNEIVLDDLFDVPAASPNHKPVVLGYAVLDVSRDSLQIHQRDLLLVALSVGLLGLLVGGFLATQMGERVVQPILSVSRRIERIGQGDFSVRSTARGDDPLHELQMALNEMAARLAWGRDEMEQRVAEATQQLRLKKDEAEQATLAKSRFLAAASHDLRQPTHALGLFIARLGQLTLDEQTHELVKSLDASVQSMQDLLDGLLDLSRLEAGAVQAQVRPVYMAEIFLALESALAPLAAEKSLRLRLRPTRLWGLSDPVLLQRIVMNLAHNALRYTECGTVLVSCRLTDQGKSVRVDVSDSGIGISQEHQTEIFREFFQVGNSGRDRAYGMGLGLNIVERTARLLGHAVSIRSGLGCGTRFSVTVPCAAGVEPARLTVAPSLPAVVAMDGLQVLVVEDDEFSRDAIRELLVSWGCAVSAFESIKQAQTALRTGLVPAVIVSDYRLGTLETGLDAIASLRAMAGWDIPACLMSGDTDAQLMQAAKDAGLTLLHKPVRPAKLRSLLRHLTAP